jgi:hypothetical protein
MIMQPLAGPNAQGTIASNLVQMPTPRRLLLAALIALLPACTPMQWVKEDATPEQVAQDAAQCQNEAWREAQFRAWPPRYGRRRFGSFNDPFFEESRLADFCMRIKGYELVPAEDG